MVVWRNSNRVSGWPYLVNILQQRNSISNKLNNGQTVVNTGLSVFAEFKGVWANCCECSFIGLC